MTAAEPDMDMKGFLSPSALLGETHFFQAGDKGAIADAAEHVAELGRYSAVEIPFIPWANDRKRISGSIRSNGLIGVQWLGGALESAGHNLSSLDKECRKAAAAYLAGCIEMAAECAISTVGILSGPDPGPQLRTAGIEALAESLSAAASIANGFGIAVLLEPLDLEMHKKGLVGKTAQVLALKQAMGADAERILISLDSAHALLNGEDPAALLKENMPLHIHLANPVLETSHPLFGDRHIPPGPPGAFGLDEASALLKELRACACSPGVKPFVSVEIRSGVDDDPWKTESVGWDFLVRSWAKSIEARN